MRLAKMATTSISTDAKTEFNIGGLVEHLIQLGLETQNVDEVSSVLSTIVQIYNLNMIEVGVLPLSLSEILIKCAGDGESE
jgi:hypothetical protein